MHLLFMPKAFVKSSFQRYLEHVVLQLVCSARTTGCPCSAAPIPGWNCLLNCPSKQGWNSVKAFKGLALKVGAFSRVDKHHLAGADHTGCFVAVVRGSCTQWGTLRRCRTKFLKL